MNFKDFDQYTHRKMDLNDIESLPDKNYDAIINLAAQAGVRHSLKYPRVYTESNLSGFMHVIEYARRVKPNNFINASSSSVYGLNDKHPFSVDDEINHMASLYVVTKRTNLIIAINMHIFTKYHQLV